MEYLTEKGLTADTNPKTLVWAGIQSGKIDMVKFLVQHGYPIHPEDIQEAKTKGYTDIVDFFKILKIEVK